MNGAADLGGMMGFGPVEPEPEGEPFHAEWERRALALTLAVGAAGRWSIDASRHARESLPPAQYLSSSYFAIWLAALERLLVDARTGGRRGDRAAAVAAAGGAGAGAAGRGRAGRAGRRVPVPARGGRAGAVPAGQRVRTRNMHPTGHTRLPRYARGRVGVVERVHGAHVLPDANAHGAGEQPQWLYTVRFAARELWGRTRTRPDGHDRRLGGLPRAGRTGIPRSAARSASGVCTAGG